MNYPKLESGQKLTTELPEHKDVEGFLKRIHDNQRDTMALLMHEMQNPVAAIDGEKSGGNNLSMVIANFQVTEGIAIQTELLAKTLHGMEEASRLQQASSMIGKTGHIDNSQKMFSGDSVTYNFDIIGKNIPKEATLHGTVVIKDEEGKEVYRKKLEKPVAGENSFTWFGKDKSGDTLKNGNYTIEVEAYYTTPQSKDAKHSLGVSVEKKGIITKVDVKTGDYYVDGKKIDKKMLSGVSSPTTQEVKEDEGFSEIDPMKYLEKTVSIRHNEVQYKGDSSTTVPFFSDEATKGATVQVRFSKNGKSAYMAQGKMDLEVGENNFKWNGKTTTDMVDIQNLIEKKAVFDSVPKGKYSYEIWVSTEDDPQSRKLDDAKVVHVDGIEDEGIETYVTSGSERYNVHSIRGIKETTKPEVKLSIDELQEKAASYAGKSVIVANNNIDFDGKTPTQSGLRIPLPTDTKIGEITYNIIDATGKTVRTIIKTSAEIDPVLNDAMTFDGLDAPSKDKVNTQIRNYNIWGNPRPQSYDDTNLPLTPNQKRDIDAWIRLKAKDLKWNTAAKIDIEWDGTDQNGNLLPEGKYSYTASGTIIKIADNSVVEEEEFPPDITMYVRATSVKDEKVLLTLADHRIVSLADVKSWIS
jgi:flagellar hook assembly protein FlgD